MGFRNKTTANGWGFNRVLPGNGSGFWEFHYLWAVIEFFEENKLPIGGFSPDLKSGDGFNGKKWSVDRHAFKTSGCTLPCKYTTTAPFGVGLFLPCVTDHNSFGVEICVLALLFLSQFHKNLVKCAHISAQIELQWIQENWLPLTTALNKTDLFEKWVLRCQGQHHI